MNHPLGLEVFYGGSSTTPAEARAAAFTAARECHGRLPGTAGSRYTVEVDGVTVAVIGTGVDESGAPAHGEVAQLLDRLDESTTIPPELECITARM